MLSNLLSWVTPGPPPLLDILFLDFDGVLHPVSGICREFSQTSLLVPLFKENPHLRIVVTSDWRFGYEDWELKKKLEVLGEYCIGSTPRIYALDEKHFPGEPDVLFSRQREILWYLHENPHVRNWLALDDIPDLYEDEFRAAHVFITNPYTGIEAHQMDIVRARLSSGTGWNSPSSVINA